jgi:hypothetical protein
MGLVVAGISGIEWTLLAVAAAFVVILGASVS